MDFKKGNWSPADFNLDAASELVDAKMQRNILKNLHKDLPGGGLPKPMPLSEGEPEFKKKPPRNVRPASKRDSPLQNVYHMQQKLPSKKGPIKENDKDLLGSMAARLSHLEAVNQSLKKEVQAQMSQVDLLKKENMTLRGAASEEFVQKFAEVQAERDKY